MYHCLPDVSAWNQTFLYEHTNGNRHIRMFTPAPSGDYLCLNVDDYLLLKKCSDRRTDEQFRYNAETDQFIITGSAHKGNETRCMTVLSGTEWTPYNDTF